MVDLGDAFELAFTAHAGQTDKAGEPYVAHLVRVAARATTPAAHIVALLHDISEDCGVALSEIEDRFGPEIAGAVGAMTKRDGESYDAYIARVRGNPIALEVKLADLADNGDPDRLARLDPATRDRLSRKYAAARAALED